MRDNMAFYRWVLSGKPFRILVREVIVRGKTEQHKRSKTAVRLIRRASTYASKKRNILEVQVFSIQC